MSTRRTVKILRLQGGTIELPCQSGFTAKDYLREGGVSVGSNAILVNGVEGNGSPLSAGDVISLTPKGMKSGT